MRLDPAVNARLHAMAAALAPVDGPHCADGLTAGVDLGTAYIVTAVVDAGGRPLAGVLTRSRSAVRDGLVLDYIMAVATLREQIAALAAAGYPLARAAAAYPPGTRGRNAAVFGNVLEAAGLEVVALTDEPSAAAAALEIRDGAVVDIGGGTTGISVIRDGRVVHTADEPTGGTHLDLVLAGHFGIDDQAAERMKRDPARQVDLFPLVRPVFEKMAAIVRGHLAGCAVDRLYLVGGTSAYPGIERVMAQETGLAVVTPEHPLLVTPLGIALSGRTAHCRQTGNG